MNKEQTYKTPLEDLRADALKHYEEASTAIHHWSSFVENAIKNYIPDDFKPTQQPQESAGVVTKEDIEFMKECNMYPHLYNGKENAAKIMTEDSEGSFLEPSDLLKLSDILFRYATPTENNPPSIAGEGRSAPDVLKSKLDAKIIVLNNPDYTFNKIIEAMEEYANQFKK